MKKILLVIIPALILTGCANKYEKNIIGTWVAEPKNQSVVMIDENTTRGGKEDYHLTFTKEKEFTLEMEDNTIKGTYEVSENGNITLKEDNTTVEKCKLMGETQLQCENYASLYTLEK